MAKTYLLDLGGTDIRFTPEGKVSVVDAIQALCAGKRPERLWHDLVKAHPEIDTLCETYRFADADPAVVVDAPGWSRIEELLPAYMLP